jgi:hypothetical protein
MFAQKKVTLPLGRHKIVILDEADSMTSGEAGRARGEVEEGGVVGGGRGQEWWGKGGCL